MRCIFSECQQAPTRSFMKEVMDLQEYDGDSHPWHYPCCDKAGAPEAPWIPATEGKGAVIAIIPYLVDEAPDTICLESELDGPEDYADEGRH